MHVSIKWNAEEQRVRRRAECLGFRLMKSSSGPNPGAYALRANSRTFLVVP